MTETATVEEELLLDTSVIPEWLSDEGNIVDDGRIFVPAGRVTAEALAEALRAQHTADKYPHHHVDFRVVKDRVEAVISGYPEV